MTGAAQLGRKKRGDNNVILLLSLKLLLLAFFILLNSLSTFEEEKSRAVIDSVNQAFSGPVRATKSLSIPDAAVGVLENAEDIVDDIGTLFDSSVPVVETNEAGRGRVMRIQLSDGFLFQKNQISFRPNKKMLLQQLAKTLLRSPKLGQFYELEFLHGVTQGTYGVEETANETAVTAPRSLELRRSGAVIQELVASGLPAEFLSIGINSGQPGIVQFIVRVYDEPIPPVDFQELLDDSG